MPSRIGYLYSLTQEHFYSISRKLVVGNFTHMHPTFREALLYAIDASGKSLRSVAIDAGVSYEILKNLSQGKSQRTNVDDARLIARAFGVSLDDFYEGNLREAAKVAIAGYVGAGEQVYPIDDHAKGGGLYHVAHPALLRISGVVGVEVKGDSMAPVYEPGDVLFYSRQAVGVPTEAVGRICIAEDDQGRCWVKQVKLSREEDRFSLLSINPDGDNLHGVSLKWAAPVRLHLPRELVSRV